MAKQDSPEILELIRQRKEIDSKIKELRNEGTMIVCDSARIENVMDYIYSGEPWVGYQSVGSWSICVKAESEEGRFFWRSIAKGKDKNKVIEDAEKILKSLTELLSKIKEGE